MSEQKEEMLRRSGNTLTELAQLVDTRGELKEAERGYDGHRQTLSVELAALKYVLIDEPIPGVPHIPSEALPLARSMVLQGGQWFLPDRVMAEFSGELTSAVNQRALERNRLTLEKLDRSQIIEFACDLDRQKQKGGHASQLYSRETALALLELTSNFTRDWTKQKGIDALNQAFDWVEAHADTNPGREIRRGLDKALADSKSGLTIH